MEIRNEKGQFSKGRKMNLGNKYRVGISPWNIGLNKKTNSRLKGGRPFGAKDKNKRSGENYSLAKLGTKVSEKTKEKLRNANLGKKQSIETILKRIEKCSGEKSHFWKGGIDPINHKIRNSFEYRLWREAVFKRDNWTCVWCKVRGNKLNADHIKPFAYYPELRFAIDNGRTLCESCHKKTDTYGRLADKHKK